MLKGSCCFLLLAAIQRVSGMAAARETREIRRWAYPVFPMELCWTTGGAMVIIDGQDTDWHRGMWLAMVIIAASVLYGAY